MTMWRNFRLECSVYALDKSLSPSTSNFLSILKCLSSKIIGLSSKIHGLPSKKVVLSSKIDGLSSKFSFYRRFDNLTHFSTAVPWSWMSKTTRKKGEQPLSVSASFKLKLNYIYFFNLKDNLF